jgi:citrate lyase subunit beta/citryl-CoA lyase
MMRSLLFVPGDRPDRMEKALASGADALILDLEDSVLAGKKAEAREAVAAFLTQFPARPRTIPLYVRINPLGAMAGKVTDEDLKWVAPKKPDGIVLPKAEGAESIRDLDNRLSALGEESARILPIATETPRAVFALGTYAGAPRLAGLTWGAEDLPAAVGAATSREMDGRFTPPYEVVRSLALFAAHAAQVPAIETIYPDFGDQDGLTAYAARGRRDGFSGMLAIHPAQVPIINAAFGSSDAEISWARRVVEAFAAAPGAGAVQLDGQMLDAPHLIRANRILGSTPKGESSERS